MRPSPFSPIPLQSVLNAAFRLIAILPRYSYVSSWRMRMKSSRPTWYSMRAEIGGNKEHVHWLPIPGRIEYQIILKTQLGVAPKYLWDWIRPPLSATSSRIIGVDWGSPGAPPKSGNAHAFISFYHILPPPIWVCTQIFLTSLRHAWQCLVSLTPLSRFRDTWSSDNWSTDIFGLQTFGLGPTDNWCTTIS